MKLLEAEARVRILSRLPGTHRIGLTASNNAFQILGPSEVDVAGHVDVRISASVDCVASGNLEVHAGGLRGPVVAKLTVQLFDWLALPLSLHIVQLVDDSGPGPIPTVDNLQAALEGAARIWKPFGILIGVPTVADARVVRARSSRKNQLRLPRQLPSTNLNHVLNSAQVPGSLDVFLVEEIRKADGSLIHGIGIPHSSVQAGSALRRGLVVGPDPDTRWLAGTIAHEIGHTLGLEHVRNMQRPRVDGTTFALQQLMHPYTPPAAPDDWPPGGVARTTTRPRFRDVGWGPAQKGGVVTLKTIPHVTDDEQASTAIANLRAHPF